MMLEVQNIIWDTDPKEGSGVHTNANVNGAGMEYKDGGEEGSGEHSDADVGGCDEFEVITA